MSSKCTVPHPQYFRCTREANHDGPCAVVPVSSSDVKYRQELAAEISKLLELPLEEILKKYGIEGWRLLIRRYLEATS